MGSLSLFSIKNLSEGNSYLITWPLYPNFMSGWPRGYFCVYTYVNWGNLKFPSLPNSLPLTPPPPRSASVHHWEGLSSILCKIGFSINKALWKKNFIVLQNSHNIYMHLYNISICREYIHSYYIAMLYAVKWTFPECNIKNESKELM